MREWKKAALLSLYKALPLKVKDISAIYGGKDDLSKLLKLGRVEIKTSRYEKDDIVVPVKKLRREVFK